MKNASQNLFNLNGKFLININHKNFACTNKSHLCFNFILCICHVFTKSDCVHTNTDKSNPVCKPLNTNVTLISAMHTEVAYSSLCQTLYIPCVHHESSPLLPAIQWTNSMQRMLACFIQIDILKLVYKRIIKFWFKLHLKIRPFSQKFLHLFEQVLRLSFILTIHCLHELVMPCYIDYSDANKLDFMKSQMTLFCVRSVTLQDIQEFCTII